MTSAYEKQLSRQLSAAPTAAESCWFENGLPKTRLPGSRRSRSADVFALELRRGST